MKTQFLAFLSFAVVLSADAATVHKAPLKGLLIDNASVVTDVTGFGSATRLESADGRTWIDAAGDVRQAQRKAVFNGMEAVSGDDPSGTVEWMFYDDGPEGGYCHMFYYAGRWDLALERLEDVDVDENGDVRQEMVQRTWSANAPWNSSTVTLNGDWGTETVQLSFVTGIVNRIAFTNDVPKIDISKLPSLTTNDVCAIVTNEVASGWICEIKELGHLYEYRDPPGFWPEDEVWSLWLWTDGGTDKVDFYCRAPEDATELNFTPWLTLRRTGGNALGLAMAKDLEKLPTHETVTNVARSVVNSVWDASLGVVWEARMHNGHLYYIAVTNKPPEVK